jgi:hypothetical protein
LELHNYSQHAVINAFQDMDFAGYERGIFGCTPHDLMHAFLEGVLKYCTRIFINGFTISQKADIDLLVDELFSQFRSSEKRNMPRVNFSKGMTNLTMITADEEVGMALTILILAQTKKGANIFSNRTLSMFCEKFDLDENESTNQSNNENTNQSNSISDFINIFEILLSFHAWYKSTSPIKWNGYQSQQSILYSIQQMLKKIKEVLPREEGNGWKIQKFHELLHIPYDISNFGSPKNFDTGIMENRLIHVGKINAKTTQKRGNKVFTKQLGDRIYHQQCFEKTKRGLAINDNTSEDDSTIHSTISSISIDSIFSHHKNQTKFKKNKPDHQVIIMRNGLSYIKWQTNKENDVHDVIRLKLESVMKKYDLEKLNVYTEIMHNRLLYRAHPNYRGGGYWYDWGMVKYALSNEDNARIKENRSNNISTAYPVGHYPSKILAFFEVFNKFHCLIHCCNTKQNSNEDSCLTECWYLEYEPMRKGNTTEQVPKLRICEVMSIADRIFVIEESFGIHAVKGSNSARIIMVKKKQMWEKYFTNT